MELTDEGPVSVLGTPRCKRHAIIADDMEVKEVFVAYSKDCFGFQLVAFWVFFHSSTFDQQTA